MPDDARNATEGDPQIEYVRTYDLSTDVFIDILNRSGLGERRPVGDKERISRMLAHANLVVVARERTSSRCVGVARALTDFAYCCYLSDLAVDKDFQGRGIGRRLIEETKSHAGPEAMCLLVSAPNAAGFYEAIGMPRQNTAFMLPRER